MTLPFHLQIPNFCFNVIDVPSAMAEERIQPYPQLALAPVTSASKPAVTSLIIGNKKWRNFRIISKGGECISTQEDLKNWTR